MTEKRNNPAACSRELHGSEVRKKRVRKRKLFRGVTAAVLSCALLGGAFLSSMLPAKAADQREVVADNSTMYTWNTENYDDNTRNVGRIWTDKSVFTDESITIQTPADLVVPDDKKTIHKTEGADFMVALSALSSTSTKTTNVSVPLDIVLVLDGSGSMSRDITTYTYEATYSNATYRTRYINVGGEYVRVYYSSRYSSWYYEDGNQDTFVSPKTSASDTDANHVQFYSRSANEQSRLSALKAAAINFVDATEKANAALPSGQKHKISVVRFTDSASVRQSLTEDMSNVRSAINGLTANGDTHPGTGMEAAASQFTSDAARSNAKEVVIFFTDGTPAPSGSDDFTDHLAWDAISAAREMKEKGALIYSIAIYEGADPNNTTADMNKYLHAVSSNYMPTGTRWNDLQLGTRVAGSDYYKTASDGGELNTIFTNIFDEISTSAVSPTLVESTGDPQKSGYITFTDTLGAFMEVKGFNAIVYNGEAFTAHKVNEGADGSATYVFDGQVTDINHAYTGTHALSNILITVSAPDEQYRQTVTVKIPAALIPLRLYDVKADNTLSITDAYPVRAFFSVGMREDVAKAMESKRYDTVDGLNAYVQANSNGSETYFYSNYWDGKSVGGNTEVAFTPATTNNFYFHVNDTPLYVKDGENYTPLTTEPKAKDTLYYNYTYYVKDATGTNPWEDGYVDFVYSGEADSSKIAVDSTTGQYYIKGGTPKIKLSNAVQFRDEKPASTDPAVDANPTGTATYALYPTWASGESVNFLGNNGRIAYTATGSLAISKTVTAEEGLTAPDQTFTFEVELTNSAYTTLGGSYTTVMKTLGSSEETPGTLTVNDNGKATVTLKASQTLTIYGIPVGTSYTVKETNIPKGFTLKVPTTNEMTGSISLSQSAVAAFTNHYDVEPYQGVQADYPVVIKKITDKNGNVITEWNKDWAFTFTLESQGEVPMPSNRTITITSNSDAVTDGKKAAFDFSKVEFEKPGKYVYSITENLGDVVGIGYSSAAYRLEIDVTDQGDGTLSAVTNLVWIKKDNNESIDPARVDDATFTNVYNLEELTTAAPNAFKFYTDKSGAKPLTAGQFEFSMTAVGDAPAVSTPIAKNTESGLVSFGTAVFTQEDVGKTFTYHIKEVIPETKTPGMTYDDTVYEVKVEVVAAKVNGKDAVAIKATYTNTKTNEVYDPAMYTSIMDFLRFTNTYEPQKAEVTLNVQKTMSGRNWVDGDNYSFTLTPISTERAVGDVPMPTTDTATITGKTGTSELGKASFGEIVYNQVGVYTYAISENSGTKAGVTYDDVHKAIVTVTVTLDETTGALVPSVSYNNSTALTEEDRKVTDAAAFTNTYKAASVPMTPSAIQVSKTLVGTPWISTDKFTFKLIPDTFNGAVPMPNTDTATILENMEGNPTKSVFFDSTNLVYDKAGTYTYYIAEQAGTIPGITYDRSVYKFEVVISDPGNGQLVVSSQSYAKATEALGEGVEFTLASAKALTYGEAVKVVRDEAGNITSQIAAFTNTYKAAELTNVQFQGQKYLLGRDAKEGEVFTFVLKHADEDETLKTAVQMPENARVTVTNAKQGYNVFTFAGITFKKAGIYTFTMEEVIPTEGADPLMHYDDHKAKIVVTVTDNLEQGKLEITGTDYYYVVGENENKVETGARTFVNHYYDPQDAKDVTNGTQTIDGQVVSAGQELTYTIRWENTDNDPADVTIWDKIPENTTYVDGSAVADLPAGAVMDASTGFKTEEDADGRVNELTWNITDVPAHASLTVTFKVKVTEQYTDADEIKNQAKVNNADTNSTTNYLPGKDVENTTAGEERNTVQVGDILTYTIRYFNPNTTEGTVIITDALVEALDFVAGSAMVNGEAVTDGQFEYNEATRTLTWTIADVSALGKEGSSGTVSFQAKVNEKALTSGATNYATINNAYTTNVISVPGAESASLTLTKTVDKENLTALGITAPTEIPFVLKVDLTDAQGNALTGSYSWIAPNTGATGSISSGGELTLMDGGEYVISGLPVGTKYTVTEVNMPVGFSQSVPANNKPATGTISAGGSKEAFVNVFTPAKLDGSTYLNVGKEIITMGEDGEIQSVEMNPAWTFTFHLSPEGDAPMPLGVDGKPATTVTVNSTSQQGKTEFIHNSAFGDIYFTEEGTYVYVIYEDRHTSIPGITYSQAAYKVTVKVEPTNDGSLAVTSAEMVRIQDYSGTKDTSGQRYDVALFRNVYDLEAEVWTPSVFKSFTNNGNPNATVPPFTFVTEAFRGYYTDITKTESVTDIPGFVSAGSDGEKSSSEAQCDTTGKMTFGSVTFDASNVGKTYEYLIYEKIPNPQVAGATYDSNRYIAQVIVSHATTADNRQAVNLDVKYYKAVPDGDTWKAEGEPLNANGPTFVNVYTPAAAEAYLTVQKTIDGRPWIYSESGHKDSFTFTLTGRTAVVGGVSSNIVPMPAGVTENTTKITIDAKAEDSGNNNPKTATFGKITYDKVGSYWYEITENIPTDPAGGLTYDTHTHVVKVEVTDDREGQLQIRVYYYKDYADATANHNETENAAFVNTYEAKTETLEPAAFTVYKNLEGRSWKSTDSFSFTLAATTDNAPMPVDGEGKTVTTVTIGKSVDALDGVSFGSITYDKAGTYVYTIKENIPEEGAGRIPGMGYDPAVYTVTVTVTDDNQGQLQVDYSYDKKITADATEFTDESETIVLFTNTYKAESVQNVPIYVMKLLNGREWGTKDTFSFKLVPKNGAPMPADAGAEINAFVTQEHAPVSFGSFSYDTAGEYQYEITEVIPSVTEENLTYDAHTCLVTVKVTDDGSGELMAEVIYHEHASHEDDNAAVFTNVFYDPLKAKSVADAAVPNISIDGKPVSAGQTLTYTIQWANTSGQIADVVITDKFPESTTFIKDSVVFTGAEGTPAMQLAADGTSATWTLTNQPIGAIGTLTFQVKVSETDTDGAEIKNQATVNSANTNITTNYLPGKTVDTTEPKIGEAVTYTIGYYHEGQGKTVTITDTLHANLDFVEGSATVDGEKPAEGQFKYDPDTRTLTWTITAGGEAEASSRNVTFQARPNIGAIQSVSENQATIDYGNEYKVVTNQVELPPVLTTSLSISKVVTLTPNQGTTIDTDKEFLFKVELVDATDTAIGGAFAYTVNGNAVGNVKHGDVIRLKHGETAIINGLPVGTKYTITEVIEDGAGVYKAGAPVGYTVAPGVKSGVLTSTTAFSETFTNTYSVSSVKAKLEAMKTLSGPVGTVLTEDQFTFGVYTTADGNSPVATGTNAAGSTPTDTETGVTTSGAVNFTEQEFTAAGTYIYYMREIKGTSTQTKYDEHIYVATVVVKDQRDGTLAVESIAYELLNGTPVTGTAPVFVNEMDLSMVQIPVTIEAMKSFSGWERVVNDDGSQWTITDMEGKFNFGLYNDKNELVATASNDENGKITFVIQIDAEWSGEHTFTMKEIIPDPEAFGVTYSTAVYTVKVNVTYNAEENKLVASAPAYYNAEGGAIQAAGVVFENSYTASPTADVTIEGSKSLFNRELTAGEYEFSYEVKDASGTAVEGKSGTVRNTVDNEKKGHIHINLGSFDKVGVYTVTIKETEGNDSQIIYDKSEKEVKVTVYDDGKGQLNYSVEYPSGGVAFVNYYMTPAELALVATKSLTGDRTTFKDGDYNFVVLPADADGNPIDGKGAVATASNVSNSITFSEIEFTEEGTYYFVMKEVEGSEIGMSYDNNLYKVTVVVSLDSENKLKAEATYEGGAVTFTNTYTNPKPDSVTLDVTKVMTGDQWALADDKFTFYVHDEQNVLRAAGKNKADGTVVFDKQIQFTKAGTYKLFVTEHVDPNNKIIGMDYDPTKYEVIVEVTLLNNNTLDAVVKYPAGSEEGLVFTNKYTKHAPILVTLEATKELTGDRTTMTDDEFKFEVWYTDAASNSDKANTKAADGLSKADGKIVFDTITIAEPGTYVFSVKEAAGSEIGMAYDPNPYTVTVAVTLEENNTLSSAIQYPNEGVKFVNTYTNPTPAQFTLAGTKELINRDLVDGEFKFEVWYSNAESNGVKKGTQAATGTNAAAAKDPESGNAKSAITFGVIEFTEAGDYELIVKEVVQGDPEIGLTYDLAERVVKVKVELTNENKLIATAEYPDNKEGLEFTNTYTDPEPAEVILKATKKLSGRGLQNEEFLFRVTDSRGLIVAAGRNKQNGEIVFSGISIKEAGTYRFNVMEVKENKANVTYDKKLYTVEVVVTLTAENKLEAKITYPDGGITFHNHYDAPPARVEEEAPTGDNSNPALLGCVMLASGILALAVVQKKRREDA